MVRMNLVEFIEHGLEVGVPAVPASKLTSVLKLSIFSYGFMVCIYSKF